jgi:hypothetical protein
VVLQSVLLLVLMSQPVLVLVSQLLPVLFALLVHAQQQTLQVRMVHLDGTYIARYSNHFYEK